MKLFANIISFVFHPLLMITLSVILVLSSTYLVFLPMNMKLLIILGALLSTIIIPTVFVLLMKKSGAISDIDITNRKERVVPYFIFLFLTIVYLFLIYKLQLPFWFIGMITGAIFALIISLCVNFYWKISVHGVGIGGLLGCVMGVSHLLLLNPYQLFMIIIIIAGLMATSRIYLGRHTPMQTYAGTCLGFACTFLSLIFSF